MADKPVKKNLSALKRVRQSKKRYERNQEYRSAAKTLTKKFNDALKSEERDKVQTAFNNIIKLLNKASSKGVLHRNNASRRISAIAKKYHIFLSGKAA